MVNSESEETIIRPKLLRGKKNLSGGGRLLAFFRPLDLYSPLPESYPFILFGGGLSLGKLMFDTGLARVIGEGLTEAGGVKGLWSITVLAIITGILVSETTSNTASASMVVPVMIAISQAAGVSPVPPALGACFGASFGFMLPVSTPPNAIVYGSGMIPILSMVRAGIVFDIIGFVVIWLGLKVLCPLLGLM